MACFKLWGLGHFLIYSLGLLALMRYRAMVPLLYLVFIVENGGRKALQRANPLRITSAGELMLGAMINLKLLTALLVGFALSLGGIRGWAHSDAQPRA